jgi:hypothetical protein
MHIELMDITTAFLNGDVDDIYVDQPDGFQQGDLVCKLKRSLYGFEAGSKVVVQETGRVFHLSWLHPYPLRPQPLYLSTQGHQGLHPCLCGCLPWLARIELHWIRLRRNWESGLKVKDLGPALLGLEIERDRPNRLLTLSQRKHALQYA